MVKDKTFYRTIFRIALPSAFQAFIAFLVVLADDMMVSWLGQSPLAAVSQANRITLFVVSTLTGLVSGSSVLISQYWGKGDMDRIKRIFSIVMWICLCVSAAVVAVISLFPQPILRLVISGDETEILGFAVSYFTIVCFSYIPYALSGALVGMLRSVEVVSVTLIISISSLLVNVFFNYALIFGHFGLPAMGVRGAAVATVITRVVELAIVWFYTFRVQKRLDIRPKDLLRPDKVLARDYVRYGLPVGITDMQWSLIGILKASVIGHLGGAFMAANSIADSMMNLGTLFTFALAGGACVVVGKAVGAGDYKRTREYSNTIQLMFFALGLIMSTVVYFLRGPFIGLYGREREVNDLATQMIALGALTLIGTTYHASCFVGINRGAGDSRFVAIVDMICGWLIVLPITFVAAFVLKLPLPIVYLCTRIDQCFKWIIALIRLRGNKWIRNVTRDAKGKAVGV